MVKFCTLQQNVLSFQRTQQFFMEQRFEHCLIESTENLFSDFAHTTYLEKSIKLI